MMRAILITLLLTACAPTLPIATAPLESAKPALQYTAPAKQMLAPISWDFPRSATQSTIKNSAPCITLAKKQNLDLNTIYDTTALPARCAVPAVDAGSNLYIGLNEANYRNLVNNYSIILMREKRWKLLLNQINAAMNPKYPP